MYKNSRFNKIVLFLSILTAGLWVLGRIIDVYRFAIAGVIFEILWLPMLGLLFILPIISLIFWVKEKFTVRSYLLYSILIIVSAITITVFWNRPG